MITPIVKFDIAQIKRALGILTASGEVRELRSPTKTRQGTISGYFNHTEKLAQAAANLSGNVPAVYITINPVNPALLARSDNKVKPRAENTTADKDVVRRTWLPVDLDAKRPTGISSTDSEHEAAIARAREVIAYLELIGVPAESMVLADSGNGAHVLVRIDLSNDADSTTLCQNALKTLDLKFSDDKAAVDLTLYNAARILKLYGTLVCKGENTADRPHRLSHVLSAPDHIAPAPKDVLVRISDMVKQTPQPVRASHGTDHYIDLEKWLATYGIEIRRVKSWQGAKFFELKVCPWNPDHSHGEAYAIQYENGAIAAGCHHSSCGTYTWHDLREKFEPKAERRSLPIQDGQAEGGTEGSYFNLTDSGNAERFAAQFGDIVRYVKEWKEFIIYKGRVWEADLSGAQTLGLAKVVARSIYQEAANEPDDAKRQELAKFAKASESEQRRQAIVKCLISEPGIEISQGDLDKDPFLLNCQNGTIDLRTGELRLHDKADLITQIVAVPYKPGTKSALWAEFLRQVFANREDVIGYVKRAIGYSATADQSEGALFFNHGSGWNGKSTFLGAITDTLGPDYTTEIDPCVLMVRKFATLGPDEAAAMFYKKRFVKSTETEEGQRLSVGLMKRMTGGEDFTCNRKYQHAFNYHPTHKLWLSGNHEPVITDTTNSIWFRLKKIPFTVTFKPDQRNKNLPKQLAREREAILAWVVEGCLAWREGGLKEPEDITKATQQYREDQDVLGDFLKECCEFQASAAVTVAELHKAYKEWCNDNDAYPLAKKTFNARLQEKGLRKASGGGNKTTWYGIGLLDLTWGKSEPEKTKTASEPVKNVNFVNENSGNSKAPSREGGFLGNSLTKLTKLTTDRCEIALGMRLEKVFEIWRSEGAPVIHLGPGENAGGNLPELDVLLSNPNVLDRHLEAVKAWLKQHRGGEQC